MAEAPNMLDVLTNDRFPAHRDSEPGVRSDERVDADVQHEDREVVSRERAPQREIEEPARESEARDVADPKAGKPKRYKVKGEELTVAELERRGLLQALISSAEQLPALSQKHQKVIEENNELLRKAATSAVAPTQSAPPQVITQAQIRRQYDGMLAEVVKLGYIEPDFAEAYPDVGTNMMHMRVRVEDHDKLLAQTIERVNQVVGWIKAQVDFRQAGEVQSVLDTAINEVAAKPGKIFEALKNPEYKADFIAWMKAEVDPPQDKINAVNIEKLWLAFNSNALLEFAKQDISKPAAKPRRSASDGPSARIDAPAPQPKSVLETLTEMRLPAEA